MYRPDIPPDFVIEYTLHEVYERAEFWIMEVVDKDNCGMLYRYHNLHWKGDQVSSCRIQDGKVTYNHHSIEERHHEWSNEGVTPALVKKHYAEYLEKKIDEQLLE